MFSVTGNQSLGQSAQKLRPITNTNSGLIINGPEYTKNVRSYSRPNHINLNPLDNHLDIKKRDNNTASVPNLKIRTN